MDDSAALSRRYMSFAAMAVAQTEADRAIAGILSRIVPNRFRRSYDSLDLSRVYEIEPPRGGAHLFKLVIYTPRQLPAISVLVTNLVDGWHSLCHLLAREHGHFQLQVKSTRPQAEWPQHKIDVWNGAERLRVVMAMRDSSSWEFIQRGEPQAFEEIELYDKRRVSDRLNRDAIVRYLQRIGWDVSRRSFWESDVEAIYFEELSKRATP